MNNKKEIKENDSQSLALANTVRVWEQPEDINKIESKKEIDDIIKEILDKAPKHPKATGYLRMKQESRSSFRSDYMKCACMGCTEATGRSWDCHTRCDGYKEFQAKNEEEKNVIKRKNPYYKSLSKEKFMKRNALNRNRRGRK